MIKFIFLSIIQLKCIYTFIYCLFRFKKFIFFLFFEELIIFLVFKTGFFNIFDIILLFNFHLLEFSYNNFIKFYKLQLIF